MSSTMQAGGAHSVKNGGFVALEGEKTASLNLLIQGRLNVYVSPQRKCIPASLEALRQNQYRLFDLEQNVFIGINDLLQGGKNSFSLVAASDCSIYSYEAQDAQGALAFINNQKDYGAYVINSLCILIDNSLKALQRINSYRNTVESVLQNLCVYYTAVAEEYGLPVVPGKISETGASCLKLLRERNAQPPLFFVKQFIESDVYGLAGAADEETGAHNKTDYYVHMLQIPIEIKKAFFGADKYIASEQINEASSCLDQALEELRHGIYRLEEAVRLLYTDKGESVYNALIKQACELREKNLDYTPAANAASYVLEKLKEISEYIEAEYGHSMGIDFQYAGHMHANAISALENRCAADGAAYVSANSDSVLNLPEELADSAEKILTYSGIPEDKANEFMMNLSAFRNMKNKFSADISAKKVRSTLTDLFFEIYHAVFKKAYNTKDDSRLIRMFLSYGYLDEKLLDQSQVMELYKLAGTDYAKDAQNVYHMPEWLGRIYSMEKDPSVSHFGYDYADTFRELKKNGVLSDKDKTAYFQDREGRLKYENDNMFRQNDKICHGHIATYMPFLHRDVAPRSPLRSHVTPARIQEKLNRILEVDFSAFHREVNYMDTAKGIEKELVMMQVIPDFILVPVYGSRAMMWQEISGKVKSSPGRLLLPVFTDENLDEMILKLIGNFRWELCRTMMGIAWNDITQSSLTSDYSDYIEFYKKNNDLSEDAKEKVKALKDRYSNRLRDIFTSDYEMWVNNESRGNPRLNKVARAIFIKHCPFSKEIREHLEKQPIFSDQLALFKHHRSKHARELESHYKRYIKPNVPLDPVMQKNLEFYRDM